MYLSTSAVGELDGPVCGDLVQVFFGVEVMPVIGAVKVVEFLGHFQEGFVVAGNPVAGLGRSQPYLTLVYPPEGSAWRAAEEYGPGGSLGGAACSGKPLGLVDAVRPSAVAVGFGDDGSPVAGQELFQFVRAIAGSRMGRLAGMIRGLASF